MTGLYLNQRFKQTRQAGSLDTTADPVEITVDNHLARLAQITELNIPCDRQPLQQRHW